MEDEKEKEVEVEKVEEEKEERGEEEEEEEEMAGASESENLISREVEREPETSILKAKVKNISKKSVVSNALPIHP